MKTGRVRNGRLLSAMAEAGLDGVGLARLARVSAVTISALVCNRRDPKGETARRVAAVLGVKVFDIWPDLGQEGSR